MEDLDLEQQEPFPVDRNGRRLGDAADQPDGGRPAGCCERFQLSVSKWMLPEDHREKYLERANCCPPPIFIVLISIAELAVFIYYAVWKPQKQWVTLDEGIWKSPLTYKPEVRQEAWRFISYMFVHAGVQHIFGNLVMQLLVGIPLELVHKGFEVGMVYMAGVLAGHPFFFNCISYFIFVVGSYWSSSSEPDSICVFPLGTSGSCFFLFVLAGFLSEVPLIFFLFFFLLADASRLPSGSLCSSIFDPLSALVGASGGVYALIGGYFMNAVVNFREMIPVLGVFRILAIVIFVATDFGFAFYRRFLSEDAGLKVSFVAHFGGIVAGMTVGYVFFSAYNQKLLKDPRFWLCIVGYLLFLIFAVVFNVVLSPAP